MNAPVHNKNNHPYLWERRKFITTLLTTMSIAPLVLLPGTAKADNFFRPVEEMTVQQVIDLILKSIPGAPFKQTVDTIKAGSAGQKVTGIVTTMFATCEVIEKAAALGANFIIAHEPTFYNHLDETNWLENDAVYQYKIALLKKHNMAVWRFHDAIHAHQPDGVTMGVLTRLGWEKYYNAKNPHLVIIPPTSFGDIISSTKKNLDIAGVKVIGENAKLCSRILMIPGAAGGRMQIAGLQMQKPDLLICGELNEWETSEYIRDLRRMGSATSLLVLGHIASEEPGLEWLVNWLQPQLKSIKVTHIPTTDAFRFA